MKDDDVPEEIKAHILQIEEWLDNNVERHPVATSVTLCQFRLESPQDEMNGDFRLLFGEFECGHRVRFGCGDNGKVKMYMPMFHSPLGAPCSYSAIEISDKERKTVNHALNTIFPRIKPYGLDKVAGEHTELAPPPISKRIVDLNGLFHADTKVINPDFSITIMIEGLDAKELHDDE